MKKALIAVLALLVVASGFFAQEAKKINFGVGADVVLPIGAFSDGYNIGIGGTARGQYIINEMISLMATAGFISFGGKDFGGVKLESGSMIPTSVVGGKYYFTPSGSRFYGGADLGISIFKTSVNVPSFNFQTGQVTNTSVSGSNSEFTFQPMVGMEMPMGSGNTKLDIAARFQIISGGNGLGVRVVWLF